MAKQSPRVYVGDTGRERPPKFADKELIRKLLKSDIDEVLDGLNDEQLFELAINIGVNASEALGVDTCKEHYGLKELGNKSIGGLNYATDVVYCLNCFLYYYRK